MVELPEFEDACDFWAYWGFQPWSYQGMAGMYRRVTAVKGGLLGEAARFYSDDFIVWRHHGEADSALVYRTWQPVPDVMLHRFVFLVEHGPCPRPTRRAYLLGLRGFLEISYYDLGAKGPQRVADLAPLIEKVWEVLQNGPVRSAES